MKQVLVACIALCAGATQLQTQLAVRAGTPSANRNHLLGTQVPSELPLPRDHQAERQPLHVVPLGELNRTVVPTRKDPAASHPASLRGTRPRSSSLLEARSVPTPYPLETVDHDKEPGSGYTEGSPLFYKQQRESASVSVPSEPEPPHAASKPHPKVKPKPQRVSSPAQSPQADLVGPGEQLPDIVPPDPMEEPPGKLSPFQEALMWIVGPGFYFLSVIIFAWLYRSFGIGKMQYPRSTPSFQGDSFSYGLCLGSCRGLNQDWQICLCAFCCPLIRWADTMSMAPLLPFWAALVLMLVLTLLVPFTYGSTNILFALVGVYFRQRLRKIYNHGPFTPKHLAMDCCIWTCCACCAIAQEAREVEHCQKPRSGAPSQVGTPQVPQRGMSPAGPGFPVHPPMPQMTTPAGRALPPGTGGGLGMSGPGTLPPGVGHPGATAPWSMAGRSPLSGHPSSVPPQFVQ